MFFDTTLLHFVLNLLFALISKTYRILHRRDTVNRLDSLKLLTRDIT